jgi:hypothetical protein
MATNEQAAFPQELVSGLAEASTDLMHFGMLSNFSEDFRAARADAGRQPFPAERSIDQRVASDTMRPLAAIEVARSAATRFPEAFNAAVATTLDDPAFGAERRSAFERGLGVTDADFAAAAIAACQRTDATLRGTSGIQRVDPDGPPPVSGGQGSLGCDLIALGAMLGGAACVAGCGPCCVAGVAEALIYVGVCAG